MCPITNVFLQFFIGSDHIFSMVRASIFSSSEHNDARNFSLKVKSYQWIWLTLLQLFPRLTLISDSQISAQLGSARANIEHWRARSLWTFDMFPALENVYALQHYPWKSRCLFLHFMGWKSHFGAYGIWSFQRQLSQLHP